jgi:hypothetical protein
MSLSESANCRARQGGTSELRVGGHNSFSFVQWQLGEFPFSRSPFFPEMGIIEACDGEAPRLPQSQQTDRTSNGIISDKSQTELANEDIGDGQACNQKYQLVLREDIRSDASVLS